MEKTCQSYSCEYSNRTCHERLRSIQATSGSRKQTVTRHSTSVAKFPAPYKDSSPSTIGDSLEDEHPRTQMRTHFQKRKEEERRNNAENKAKRQHINMKPDTKGKRPSAIPLTGEIAAREYPEDIDDVTMSESQTFPTSNGSSCRSSGRDLWMFLGVFKKMCMCSCKLSGEGCSILVSKKWKHRFGHL